MPSRRTPERSFLHEDGLYRHLHFARPDSFIWHFDLITWPGYLTIVGDIGSGYTFRRTDDMLAFFDQGQGDGQINADYWAQKLEGPRGSERAYSRERFIAHVTSCTNDLADCLDEDDVPKMRAQVAEDVLAYADDELAGPEALSEFEFAGHRLDDDMDPAAWEDYNHHFLIALHAILWGAKKYHAHQVATR